MKLTLKRIAYKEDYVAGALYIDGEKFCDTMERPWLNNQPDVSCVPTGEYKILVKRSARFRRKLPLLLNVPGREGILIHSGNVAKKDSTGCILVGRNTVKGMVTDSRATENMLMDALKGNSDITLEII